MKKSGGELVVVKHELSNCPQSVEAKLPVWQRSQSEMQVVQCRKPLSPVSFE